jgi:signal transduction histidine kinase
MCGIEGSLESRPSVSAGTATGIIAHPHHKKEAGLLTAVFHGSILMFPKNLVVLAGALKPHPVSGLSMDGKCRKGPGEANVETEATQVEHEDAQLRVEQLINQLRDRSAELEAANRELRRVSQYRSLFLARMSHELRTPLTSILGFSEILLEQEQLSDTQRRFCQKIQKSGFQLQASLDQLVDLSRLEAGQKDLFLHEFPLRQTLNDSIVAAGRQAQKQGVLLDCDVSPEVTTVVSDQGKLRQIIHNFLAWSINRSGSGQQVVVYAETNARSRLVLRIVDEGEPVENAARVFDFDESSRDANVNELGIIIARQLVKLLKGTVALRKRNHEGMEVIIQIPLRPAKDSSLEWR